MYTLGIDIGSSSSKAVLLKDGKERVSQAVIQVGTGTSGPARVIEETFGGLDITIEDMDYIVATGYGRFSVEEADKQISEISCHAKGIYYLYPTAHTIIDIGGQDAKAIRLDGKGNIGQFVMNDKCAAGTGRFLDVMSRVLEIPLSELGDVHFKATQWAFVSSTCTVFAESEVISLLSQGVSSSHLSSLRNSSMIATPVYSLNFFSSFSSAGSPLPYSIILNPYIYNIMCNIMAFFPQLQGNPSAPWLSKLPPQLQLPPLQPP